MQTIRFPEPRGIVIKLPPCAQVQWLQLRVLQAQLTLQEASAQGPQLPELVAHLQLRCQLEIDSQGEEPSSEVHLQPPRNCWSPVHVACVPAPLTVVPASRIDHFDVGACV